MTAFFDDLIEQETGYTPGALAQAIDPNSARRPRANHAGMDQLRVHREAARRRQAEEQRTSTLAELA